MATAIRSTISPAWHRGCSGRNRPLVDRLALLLLALLALVPAARAQPPRAYAPWKAQWIAHPEAPPQAAGVFHFRRSFDLAEVPKRFRVNVSADNRYRLFVNGTQVAIGPARGDLLHWRYETVDLSPHLRPGRNVLAAQVWNWGEYKPAFQISRRTAFLLRGEDNAIADTGAGWKAHWDRGYGFTRVTWPDNGGFYVAGPGEVIDGTTYAWGATEAGHDDSAWVPAAPLVVRPEAAQGALPYGSEQWGSAVEWQLVPRTIPQPEERPIRFAAVRRAEGIEAPAWLGKARGTFTIPANRKVSILLDQGELTMGYPVLSTGGGAGASAVLTYAEGLVDAKGQKGKRGEIEGKTIRGVRDRIRFDGGARTYRPLWLRTWRYIQLDVETGAEPLRIHDISGIFTAYPFEQRASFESDQQWIEGVWDIDWRVFRLSAFESFWDTPYYEQLQYVGDTRIEALIALYNAGDDRLVRHAITLFDESRNSDGITTASWPSASPGYIPGFSLWWVAMVHDYAMLRDDPAFIRRQLPGIRGVLAWFERHVDETGMLGPTPWWNFLDWNGAWDRGVPTGADSGHSTPFTLKFAHVLQLAADLEDGAGQPAEGVRYRALAEKLNAATRARAWDAGRGLFADSAEHKAFSQQTNALAVLSGAVPAEERRAVMERVLADKSLVQASFYFRFYIDEAMRRAGLADRYLERLEPWREMIRIGLTTTPENPEPTRSDSHAWSAHPNYHLLATVLGIRPASPGFKTVEIAPALGALQRASGKMPHPAGEISVKLERAGAGARGDVTLPPGVSGRFVWRGRRVRLHPGLNSLEL
jgi:alpha-L-rhamnosidase